MTLSYAKRNYNGLRVELWTRLLSLFEVNSMNCSRNHSEWKDNLFFFYGKKELNFEFIS